jgi:signal transduction histidine kinase/CheY-like chemotaxis protein/purine-cytosine permease-like protein
MTNRQRIIPVRREYNRWVANQTLEDFALRFTAKGARRWSGFRVAQTALGSVSFLALEAIGGTLILSSGFTNTVLAVLVVCALIFATGVPIGYYAAKHGVDIDLLTRGAGFGYIGSTVTSLVYAGFTFIFFAIEAAIMALALEMCFGLPLAWGYLVSAVLVVPLVTYGITLISRFQLWTQPLWLCLNLLPIAFVAAAADGRIEAWTGFPGTPDAGNAFDLNAFGAAAGVVIALMAQIGEQVDFLRFMPPVEEGAGRRAKLGWWISVLGAGAGWIVPGMAKILLGSFLAVLALEHGIAPEHASEPAQMYAVAFGYVLASPGAAIALTGVFVVLSQLKINVTNAYAGSIAWSNFFSRLTHSHPGRVVWLVFNVAIALLLMELGIYKALERTLGIYAIVAVAWVGVLAADLAISKPLGLSPPGIEFKRAHLYDINPVGIGAMAVAIALALAAAAGAFGATLRALAPFVALAASLVAAPAIAALTGGRYYLARKPRAHWRHRSAIPCVVCEHAFEPEDMAFCPAYSGAICSLCCTLDARCHDLCKPAGRVSDQIQRVLAWALPERGAGWVASRVGRYVLAVVGLAGAVGSILAFVYAANALGSPESRAILARALSTVFLIVIVVLGVLVWFFVLLQDSRCVAREETARQTALYRQEIAAHRTTDAKLERAKESAEAANNAKSRYVVGVSHEMRTPLNAILGYAQLLEADTSIPDARQGGIRTIRRSAEHLSGLIDGLLDISRMEAGRLELHRDQIQLVDFLDQIVDMFRLQAKSRGLEFRFSRPDILPAVVMADEKRLRQILINLLSNAIKFTDAGHVALALGHRSQVAEFTVADTGHGIPDGDLKRIFEPFNRGTLPVAHASPGTGLGLTIAQLLSQVMGGDISVSSRVGAGSTFRVRVLLSAVTAPARITSAAQPISGYAGPRRTIMVVDDDADHRSLMHEFLQPLGFALLSAADGQKCLDMATRYRPELFLLDIAMPGMNGWELAHELRRTGHEAARFAMLSANVHEIRPAGREGVHRDEMIAKPINLRDFLGRIQALLELEWVGPGRTSGGDRPEPTVPPRSEHLAELIRLGQIGYVRGIEAKLSEIEAEASAYAPFVQEMRGLIQVYDLRRYLKMLERLRGGA